MAKCNYLWPESSSFHRVYCQLDKDHKDDHAFYFKTDPKDIKHDHKWVLIYTKNDLAYWERHFQAPRGEKLADAEYRCSFCGAKRLEYYK